MLLPGGNGVKGIQDLSILFITAAGESRYLKIKKFNLKNKEVITNRIKNG